MALSEVKTLIFTILLATASPTLFRHRNRPIYNGFKVKAGQLPFSANLNIANGTHAVGCSGALLNNEWILTAAHCINVYESEKITVFLGVQNGNKVNEEGIVLTDAKGHAHPDYPYPELETKYDPTHDLALIKLPEKVKFTDRIQPVLLPKSTEDLYVGAQVIASGFGKTNDDNNLPILHWAPTRIMSNAECEPYYPSGAVTETTICARGPKNESICQGDSGSPLVLRSDLRTVIGVTRYGADRCDMGYPQGFARVTYYLPWIKKMTGIE